MPRSRNNRTSMVVLIVLLGIGPAAGHALANTAEQISLVCANNWPESEAEQRECRELQTAAADKLLMRIETAAETSLEFSVAKSCIEQAKVEPPAMIEWTKALACFRKRFREPKAAKDLESGSLESSARRRIAEHEVNEEATRKARGSA